MDIPTKTVPDMYRDRRDLIRPDIHRGSLKELAAMKVKVDVEKCSSCGLCAESCPDVFEMGDDDIAKVKVETVPADGEAAMKEAVENCPTEAIIVE